MPCASGGSAPAALLQGFGNIGARTHERWCDARKQPASQRHAKREKKSAKIEANGLPARDVARDIRRHMRKNDAKYPLRQKNSERGPKK